MSAIQHHLQSVASIVPLVPLLHHHAIVEVRRPALFVLPFLFALQAAAIPPSKARQPDVPTEEERRAMDQQLQAQGFPPGLESWVDDPTQVDQVMISPLFYQPFVCAEHPLGQLHGAGDALGTDCMMVGGITGRNGFERMYSGDGAANSDWYGWHAEVHAPFDGVVKFIYINPSANLPGVMGKPPASLIEFERADGVDVVYAHIADPRVKVGDHVSAGQIVAIDGNNGMARNPHIHVGAYKGSTPLQIRWDSAAMGRIPALASN